MEENRPVALFGLLPNHPDDGSSIAHAVTLTKVGRMAHQNWWTALIITHTDYKLWVHYGWYSDTNDIEISWAAFSIRDLVYF